MFPQTKSQLFWVFVSLLALRLVIGWHFYSEGVSKIKAGNFSAEPFFSAAKGPLATVFHQFIPDYDGRLRLGLVQSKSKDGKTEWSLDPLVTEELWKGFAYRAARHYGFGDPELIKALQERADKSESRIATDVVRTSDPPLEIWIETIKETRAQAQAVRNQKDAALAVAQKYIDEYRALLSENETEILAYFRGDDRSEGFQRDGKFRADVTSGVRSLREQSDQIKSERSREARPWLADIDPMWNGVEADINALAVGDQKSRGYLKIDRPHQNQWTMLPWINRCVPWFDTIVGACLILGLFTRMASLAGATFLAGIIATQPPFVTGAAPTVNQTIELVGLLVLFATSAGLYAGLDVFVKQWLGRKPRPAVEEQ